MTYASEAAYWQEQSAKAYRHAMDFASQRGKADLAKVWQDYARLNSRAAMKWLDHAMGAG